MASVIRGSDNFNTSGSLLQVAYHSWNSSYAATSTLTDVPNSSMVFTPKSPNSTLLITVDVHMHLTGSPSAGGTFNVFHDGTMLDSGTLTHEHYVDAVNVSDTLYMRSGKTFKVASGGTTPRTVKVKAIEYSGSFTVNFNSSCDSMITIFEIGEIA